MSEDKIKALRAKREAFKQQAEEYRLKAKALSVEIRELEDAEHDAKLMARMRRKPGDHVMPVEPAALGAKPKL